MNQFKSIFITALALTLAVGSAYSQRPQGGARGQRPQHGQQDPAKEQVQEPVENNIMFQKSEHQSDSLTVDYSKMPMLEGSTPKRYLIKKVNIHGVKNINHDILLASSGLVEGDSITLPSSFISNVITKLWSQRLYADVKVGAQIEGEDVVLDLMLKERPRVFEWSFSGISKTKQRDLKEDLKLKRNTELSDYVIAKNTKLIKDYMLDKGFRNTEVELDIKNDSIRKNMVNVDFKVDQKEKVRIQEIIFEGNEAFEDKRLRRAFKKTHQKSWNIFTSKKLKDEEYEEDKELLIDFYNSKGYRNAVVLRDSIYDIDEKNIGIKIWVSEGNKYYIRDISWVGNSVYDTEQLQGMFGVKSGDTYDKKSMHKRLGIGRESNPQDISISTLYQNEGYLTSKVEPAEIIIGTDSIDLEVKIFEGKQFTINDIKLSGNNRVDDEVIRRELYIRPGEMYNQALLMQTIQTLNTMGHFNPEAIMPDIQPVPGSSDLVDIGFALEEQASDQFNISGGWGNNSFIGSIGVTLSNLSIKKLFDKDAWRPYPSGENQRLSIQGTTNGTYYSSLALSFTDPWFGGKKPNSFTVSAHYSDQNNGYWSKDDITQYFRTKGLAVGLGRRHTWPDPYFTTYFELSYMQYNLYNWDYFVMKNGKSNMISLKGVFSRNSIDQPFFPRRGSEFTLSVEATPPYSAFDGKDYADRSMTDEDRYKFIEYHKWQFKSKWVQSLTPDQKLVLYVAAEMGYVGNYNKYKVSPFELFEVGGDGMSGYTTYGVDIIPMRGYPDGGLNPQNSSYAHAYNKYTMELRFPVILEPSSQIYVLAFAEAGNGFDTWRDFSPFQVKRAAGVGVRLSLPMVGVLGLDWGYGFDPQSGENTPNGGEFQFILGQQF